ncbi:L-2-amino-thiazoline-4-carboxylic acid hydrolase [Streptomyces sp. LX-29]|uniref:L-2-amino-thiazoline-4-carboxylic acid hydrolase n=1 Tax=Streptomyces sp. LX-29 TaxID=2900152 RepID=UPI00240E7008|nr:L-2-amino-thiazoline-4-carboxylic acid hydrolase [Streptomyces sp. LX-29]WFB10800.1 L-2-amino-thiazoline-4-carboxylic acid hydrolase [Streptomyces sp. LX-29]
MTDGTESTGGTDHAEGAVTPGGQPRRDTRAQARAMLRERLRRYLELEAEHGTDKAREVLLEGYPERQAARMGPLITGCSLAEGIGKALPRFAAMGFLEEAVDVSTEDEDACMEVCRTCMCLTAAQDLGETEARPILCELDFEATRRAFPELTIESLRRRADGHHVCVFRYSRAAAPPAG